jgi:formate hydrogenlyase subunit 3/multisubunit Na+/H+ antiporter MnhD subunit
MDVKGLLASKTVWGTIVQIAALAAMFFQVDLGDQGGWVEVIVALVGAVTAIYGRIVAVKKIGGVV